MKTKHFPRVIAVILALVMVLGAAPWSAMAESIATESAKVEQWDVTLTDDLRLNFYLSIPSTGNTQIQVTVGGGDPVSYNASELAVSEDGYYVASANVAAAQMTDNINLAILTDGTQVVNSDYTLAQYAATVLENDDMGVYHKLVLQMLNYGAKAQVYFDHNTNNLANEGHELTEETAVPSEKKDFAVNGAVADISFYGASLLLQDKIGIRFYFDAPNGVENYTFTVGETRYEAVFNGTRYYVQINGINPQCYNEDVTLTVSDGEVSQSVTYSPMHYMVRMANSDFTSAELKALLTAMYGYHLEACEVAKALMSEITIGGVIVEDTYVSANNTAAKDTNYADKTELNANNSSNYRPLFKFDLSDALESEGLAENKKFATVSFTFGVPVGKDLLADADYSIYGFLPGEGASDVDFTAITWTSVKDGEYSKIYRYSGNENCVFLKKEVPATEVADIVSVGLVDNKTYITYTLPYTDIEQFICTDAGDTYGYLIMGFDFQQTIRFASMENESYSAPAVSVTYFVEKYDTDIYISSAAADGGNGTLEKPYNSLDDISELKIGAGTHIYLERGSRFSGQLFLENVSGSQENPIVVASYGEGDKPVIDGKGLTGTGVLRMKNCSNIIVKNLELTDSVANEGDRRGVLITCDNNEETDEVITYENITLDNLYIHDIHGYLDAENSGMSIASKKTGGIQVWSNDGLGRIDGLNITNCRIEDVSNAGIATWYMADGTSKVSPYEESFKDYAHLNVNISGNKISNIGKNAIFVRNLLGGVIEENIVHDTALYCVSGNSIVTSYVDGTVVQYNEGYNNMATKASDGALQDGCMLDADLYSKDTIWQYNYSHDNAFGLFINCTNSEDKATVRYNLSVNDHGDKGIIYLNYASSGIEVYNNTIITGTDTQCIIQSSENGNSNIYNNIIYNRSADASFAISGKMESSYNLIYSEDGCSITNMEAFTNENGIYTDPLFVGYPQAISAVGTDNLHGYILRTGSPALGVGTAVEGVDKDIYGNAYSQSVGAYCGKGHAYTSLTVVSNLRNPMASTVVDPSDLSVTATCSCGKNFAITDGIELENATLVLGENNVTVSYGGISTDIVINVTSEATVLDAVITDDTYVYSSGKDNEYTTRTELSTFSDSFRDYFRVNISDAMANELFLENKDDAKLRLVLAVTSGDAAGAEIVLKTYAPAAGITDVDFSALTWNSVNNKEGAVGAYSALNWGNGIELSPTTAIGNGNIIITLSYNDIADYVDENGNILLVFGTHTSGLKVGSTESEANKPVAMVVLGEVHFCVYDQKVADEKYLASANCEEKAKYYLSCTCGAHGEDTFEYGEVIAHAYESLFAVSNLEAPTAGTVVAASDLTVTAVCSACGNSFEITEGIELEGVLLAAGENTVTVKLGKLTTTVVIEAAEQTNVLTGTVTDDTYVDSSNKTSDFTAKETLNTNSSSFRTYLRVNISNILENEQFLANKDNAQVQIVLTIAGGSITDNTTYTLKAYTPAADVTDVDFSNVTWSNVSTSGTYSGLNWGCGTALTTSASADGSNIILTLNYSDIAEYVDGNGNILFAFGTNTSGLKVASNESTTYAAPAFKVIW